jgi:heme/copper-type cytochrome/quinol oxidase subunit 2
MEKEKIVITILILGVIGFLGYCSYLVNATTDTTALEQTISSGTLSISAPTSITFGSITYSFSAQTSSSNTLNDINPKDETGSQSGWTVNATCTDWTGTGISMDYDGDGSTTGVLTINQGSATCTATYGDTGGVTVGSTDSFSVTTTSITVVSATAGNGDGDYDCDSYDLQQFIPGLQQSGTYTTTLTVEIT